MLLITVTSHEVMTSPIVNNSTHKDIKNQCKPLVSGVQQSPVDYSHKGPLMRKCFHISMTSYHWKNPHKTGLRGRSSPKEMNKKIARHQVARCYVDNEDVFWAAPTGDAPTTSELSTVILPTNIRLILEVWREVTFQVNTTHVSGAGYSENSEQRIKFESGYLDDQRYSIFVRYHFKRSLRGILVSWIRHG